VLTFHNDFQSTACLWNHFLGHRRFYQRCPQEERMQGQQLWHQGTPVVTDLIKNVNTNFFNSTSRYVSALPWCKKRLEAPLDHLASHWSSTIINCYHWTLGYTLTSDCHHIYKIADKYPHQQFEHDITMSAVTTLWDLLTKCQTVITFITNTSDGLPWPPTLTTTTEKRRQLY